MKYKDFKKWCKERASEGTWGLKQATFCINVINYVDAHWFWQREKVWKEEYEHLTYLQVIKPINDLLGDNDFDYDKIQKELKEKYK